MQKKLLNNKYKEYISMSYILSIMLLNIVLLNLLFSYHIDKIYFPTIILLLLLLTLFLSNNIFKKKFTSKPFFKDYLYLSIYMILLRKQ